MSSYWAANSCKYAGLWIKCFFYGEMLFHSQVQVYWSDAFLWSYMLFIVRYFFYSLMPFYGQMLFTLRCLFYGEMPFLWIRWVLRIRCLSIIWCRFMVICFLWPGAFFCYQSPLGRYLVLASNPMHRKFPCWFSTHLINTINKSRQRIWLILKVYFLV